jgi:preprotein translocase subunit SecA
MNKQREIIYNERNKVLEGENVREQVMDIYPEIISEIIHNTIQVEKSPSEWDLKILNEALEKKLLPKGSNLVDKDFVKNCDSEDLLNKILNAVEKRYFYKIEEVKQNGGDFSDFERFVLLRVVDSFWMDHIDQMSQLRNEIVLQGYGQHDPIVAYKRIGFEMFDEMINKIREQTALFLLNINIEIQPVAKQIGKPIQVIEQKATVKAEKTVGRNAPCPCGSGKKYKNCCGRK